MATIRLDADTIYRILTDPDYRRAYLAQLSVAQRQKVVKTLNEALRSRGLAPIRFEDPVEMAVSTKSQLWSWMGQAKHIRFISAKVAGAVRAHRNLAIMMPPRTGKSTTCSVWTPAWALSETPRLEVMLLTYGDDFAVKWGGAVRDLIFEFGEDWNLAIDPEHTSAKAWWTTARGSMHSIGLGGSVVGRGTRLLICDDLMKEEDADSPLLRQKVWDRFQGTALSRVESGGSIIVIMQRWHEDDIIGRLEKQHAMQEGLGAQFDFVRLPALAEKNDPLGRAEGEGLWPEAIPQETWEKRRAAVSPYTWSALYQQRPSPEGGGIILRSWWGWYRPEEVPAKFDKIIQTWDLTLKDKETSDPNAGFVLGLKDALVYVLAGWISHGGLPEVIQQFHIFQRVFGASFKLIEEAASGPAFIQMMRRRVAGIIPVPARANKLARVKAAVPAIMSHNVLLPERNDDPARGRGTKERWVWDLIEQCAAFPKGANDDAVDALIQGINFLDPLGHATMLRKGQEFLEGEEPILVDPLKLMRDAFHTRLRGAVGESLRTLRALPDFDEDDDRAARASREGLDDWEVVEDLS